MKELFAWVGGWVGRESSGSGERAEGKGGAGLETSSRSTHLIPSAEKLPSSVESRPRASFASLMVRSTLTL